MQPLFRLALAVGLVSVLVAPSSSAQTSAERAAAAAALDSLFGWADTILFDPGERRPGALTSYPTRIPSRQLSAAEWTRLAPSAEVRTDTLPNGRVLHYRDTDRPMELLWETHPRSAFLVSVSPVRFDATGTTAEVTVARRCGPRCGSGDRVYLRYLDGRWRVQRVKPLWQS